MSHFQVYSVCTKPGFCFSVVVNGELDIQQGLLNFDLSVHLLIKPTVWTICAYRKRKYTHHSNCADICNYAEI